MAEAAALIAGWVLLALLAAAGLAALLLASRRMLLRRRGGTVECGLRAAPAAAWRLGLAAYRPGQLEWFSAFGPRLRPEASFDRRSLRVLSRRPAALSEAVTVGAGAVVIEVAGCPGDGRCSRRVEFAMSQEALTGFLSWLESAPPGPVSRLH